MPKRVEVNKTLRGRMNFKGRLLQKQTNSATKLQKKRRFGVNAGVYSMFFWNMQKRVEVNKTLRGRMNF